MRKWETEGKHSWANQGKAGEAKPDTISAGQVTLKK